jgi:hypothetical protein
LWPLALWPLRACQGLLTAAGSRAADSAQNAAQDEAEGRAAEDEYEAERKPLSAERRGREAKALDCFDYSHAGYWDGYTVIGLFTTGDEDCAALCIAQAGCEGFSRFNTPKTVSRCLGYFSSSEWQGAATTWTRSQPTQDHAYRKKSNCPAPSQSPTSHQLAGLDRDRSKIFVAWLISGQVPRFIYKDSAKFVDGGLRAWSGCAQYASHDCPILVDVHIAVSNTHVKQFFGADFHMPYETGPFDGHTGVGGRGLDEAALEANYKMLGANMVRATILGEDHFNKTLETVREEILIKARATSPMASDEFDKFWQHLGNIPTNSGSTRFIDNGNMMYMRHLAYKSAVEAEKALAYKYTHVLYTREDNVFVHPSYTLLQIAKDMDNGFEPLQAPASMLVDNHCGFQAWSDKIHFGNRRGIDILFAGTRDEHISMLASWINQCPTAHLAKDPLKTEDWFQRRLTEAHAIVKTFDFFRTEARYVSSSSEPCTGKLYRRCSSVGNTFKECPRQRVTKHASG